MNVQIQSLSSTKHSSGSDAGPLSVSLLCSCVVLRISIEPYIASISSLLSFTRGGGGHPALSRLRDVLSISDVLCSLVASLLGDVAFALYSVGLTSYGSLVWAGKNRFRGYMYLRAGLTVELLAVSQF